MNTDRFDYIIIGAGSSGCVLANRLSQDSSVSVLLVEAGGNNSSPWLHLPVGYFRTIYDPRFSNLFDTELEEATGMRNIIWPRGRIIGGSSSINGLIFIRGQKADYDDWQKMGAQGWCYKDVLPFFKSIETFDGISEGRGDKGELKVSQLRNKNAHCKAWIESAVEYGLIANKDFNGIKDDGVGAYNLSLAKRFRSSAATAFLSPIKHRANLTILTKAMVSKVLINHLSSSAEGIELLINKKTIKIHANREVILSAGAIQTPQLLQLSGIGPAKLLEKYKIKTIADRPQVGQNLQDHYQMRAILEMKDNDSLNKKVRNPLALISMGCQWLFNGSGPLTVGAGQVGGSAQTKYAEINRPDIQFNVMPLSVNKPGDPLHDFSGFTTSVWQCHPKSRGSINISSNNILNPPKINSGYFSNIFDLKVMVEGIKMIREIHNQQSFKDRWRKEVFPGDKIVSDKDIAQAIKKGGGTVFHCVGTCRMGEDDDAVVDSNLKVKGIANLRVIDASVMPKITSANTNAAAIMIAEKGAALILNNVS